MSNADLPDPLTEPCLNGGQVDAVFCDIEDQALKFDVPRASETYKVVAASIKKKVEDQERGSLVAVHETVVLGQRLGQGRGLLVHARRIADVRPTYGGLDDCYVADTWVPTMYECRFVGFDDVPKLYSVVPDMAISWRVASGRLRLVGMSALFEMLTALSCSGQYGSPYK
ncbi:MAG: hypothetical protein ACRD5Z_06705 [Bryobacteraceae bacterium]